MPHRCPLQYEAIAAAPVETVTDASGRMEAQALARSLTRLALAIMRRVHVEQLAGNAIGSLDDNFVIVEWTAEVGDHWIAPLHVHDEDDEAWYVLLGTLGFRLGGEEIEAHAGSAVLARRGTAHTFWNAGSGEARYLLVMTPRIARLVEEIHGPGADVAAIFAAHKSRLVPEH